MNFQKYGRTTDSVTVERFRLDTFEELKVEETPTMNELFTRAWNYGHSYGYEEVFEHFKGLLGIYYDCSKGF